MPAMRLLAYLVGNNLTTIKIDMKALGEMKGVDIRPSPSTVRKVPRSRPTQDNLGEPYRRGITLWIGKDGEDRGPAFSFRSTTSNELISNLLMR